MVELQQNQKRKKKKRKKVVQDLLLEVMLLVEMVELQQNQKRKKKKRKKVVQLLEVFSVVTQALTIATATVIPVKLEVMMNVFLFLTRDSSTFLVCFLLV